MAPHSCANCRFFLLEYDGGDEPNLAFGKCRRYPRHLTTRPWEWCGEFARDRSQDFGPEDLPGTPGFSEGR